MKRVVVTGIGIVSCLGNNQEEIYRSLLKNYAAHSNNYRLSRFSGRASLAMD